MEKGEIVRIVADHLKRCPRAEFEIFHSQSKVLSIEVKGGQLDHLRSSSEVGLALRVLHEGRLGFSYLFGPNSDGLIQLTDRAVELAGQADRDPLHSLSPPEPFDAVDLDIFDTSLSAIGAREKIDRVREMEDSAFRADPRVRRVRKAEYEEVTNAVSIINSRGVDLNRETTLISMSLTVVAEDNNCSEMGWEFDAARHYADIDPTKIGESAARRGARMLGSRQISTRTCPAVLDNRVVCDLLSAWAPSFLGDNVCKGKSYLRDKIGQGIASPMVHLIDDGLYPRGLGSAPFDDEGTPQRKTALVQGGRLLTYLYDRYWSKKAGSKSTGNSVRGQTSSPPAPSPSNLFISPGTRSFDQLTGSMEHGFLITDLMGVHLADPVSGEFSLGASGMWIEKGEALFPVKGVTMSGSIHELFCAVDELGDDLRFFGRLGAPSALVGEVIISGP